MKLYQLSLAAALLALLPAGALAKDPFRVKDFVGLPMLGGATMAPDGSRIAFHRTVRDLKKNTYKRQVWLANPKSGNSMQITREPGNSWGPIWLPLRQGLAFYSTRNGKLGLWVTRFDHTDPVCICKGPVAAASFSPDGNLLAFLAPPKKDPKVKGFGRDPEIWTDVEDKTKWPQLWILDLKTKKRKQLTDGSAYIYQFDWHPSGKTLAFTFDKQGSEGVTEDHNLGYINLVGKTRIVGTGPVKFSHPRWSPDGKRLAFFRDRTEEYHVYLTIKDIMIMDVKSGKITHNLTEKWEGNPTGRLSSPGENLHWTPDGQKIWFVGGKKATLNVYRVPADGTGKVESVTEVDGELGGISFDEKFSTMAFGWTDFTHPKDFFVLPAKPSLGEAFTPKQITKSRDLVARFELRMPQRLTWKSTDGFEVEGFLFLPTNHDGDKPAPVIFDAHGGPAFRWGNAFSHRYMWHVFADQGLGSLIFNPRGSTAYGLKFQQGNFQGFGQGDFQDLMAGVDMLIAKKITAPDRIGMTGYSYGGYLTNSAISYTTRFKAAVSIAGGFNYASAMGQSNSILPRAFYLPLKSEENMFRMLTHSPIARVMKIKTPTLLLHGKKDTAVHYMQAQEMFTLLQLCNTPTKLVLYPGEGHGINQPTHMTHYLEQSIKWFQHYLPGWQEQAFKAK